MNGTNMGQSVERTDNNKIVLEREMKMEINKLDKKMSTKCVQ